MTRKLMALAFVSAVVLGGPLSAGPALAGKATVVYNPVLVYLNRSGNVEVSNADGTAPAVLVNGGRRPTWSPRGYGTPSSPYHIVYESPLSKLRQFDVTQANNGVPTAGPSSEITTQTADQACAADISPDGTHLVFGECSVETGVSSLFRMDIDITTHWVTPNSDVPLFDATPGAAVTWASFDPTGTKIAFIENGPAVGEDYIKIWDGSTLTPVVTPLLHTINGLGPRFIEWSPTPGGPLTFSGTGGIYTIDVAAGSQPVLRTTGGAASTWSADGTELAFSANTGIAKINLNTGKITTLVRGADHPKYRN